MAETHQQDVEYLARKASNTGYQILSLLTPPAYTAFVLTRRGRHAFSINGMLRSTWVGGVGGALGGAGIAYARYSSFDPAAVQAKRIQIAYDTGRVRAEDHSTIGAILFGVLTPALLWKRAKLVHLILGGAGLGSSVGILTHYVRSLSGDIPPKVLPPTHA
ncbi:hypothetical protein D9758_001728 [Tetrapyrgos nigripes]|uniref:Uncharacterized protein n=1 Tax=Tetrapyrgos nigripes TaxID=182062 RepID=A0A8H5GX87_9AGAR|nr:hypothetical protein D9758_001728 [Tetrapyrgos nigripes]